MSTENENTTKQPVDSPSQNPLESPVMPHQRAVQVAVKDKGPSPSKDCFVATEVYGNASAREVKELRRFRDKVLVKSTIGRSVVSFYYSGAGESIARSIRDHFPFLVQPIKLLLNTLLFAWGAFSNLKKRTRI